MKFRMISAMSTGLLAVFLSVALTAAAARNVLSVPSVVAATSKSFEVYSAPAKLAFGQVYNKLDAPVTLPDAVKKDLAQADHVLTGYHADVVEFDDEGEVLGSVPLYDCYLHHYGAILGKSEDMHKFSNMLNSADTSAFADLGLDFAYGYSPAQGMPMKHVEALVKEFSKKAKSKPGFIGGGSGAEERRTKHEYPKPYGMVLEKGMDAMMPLMHLINTRGDVDPGTVYSKKAECLCSSDRQFDYSNGTIDGKRPNIPFLCNLQLLAEGNPSCSLETYQNGFRCCEHLWYVSEPEERSNRGDANFGMKFTFHYEPLTPEVIPLRGAACCDATGNISSGGQIEYDIPQCKDGEECVHTLVSYQYIDAGKAGLFGPGKMTPEDRADIAAGRQIDVIDAVGHQHLGASPIGIKLYKDSTDELLCSSTPIFGQGTEPGNEKGYVVGMTPCRFGGEGGKTPPRLRRDDVVRIESSYNNTEPHYGVMSLFLLNVAEVPLPSDSLVQLV